MVEKIIMLFFRRHVDYSLPMHFKGRVVNKKTGEPISGVSVFFLDTSFDHRRSKQSEKYAISLGESDADGNYERSINYLWGAEVFFLKIPRVGKNFKLKFVKEGFFAQTFQYESSEFLEKVNIMQASLINEIALDPKDVK